MCVCVLSTTPVFCEEIVLFWILKVYGNYREIIFSASVSFVSRFIIISLLFPCFGESFVGGSTVYT